MKEVKAFIKPSRTKKVIDALIDAGIKSLTLSQAEGTGAFKSRDSGPSLDCHVTDSPVVRLELVSTEFEVDKVLQLILGKAGTTTPGDGIVYVLDVEQAVSIKGRTPLEG